MSNLFKLFKKNYIKISKKIGFIILLKDQRKSIHSHELRKFNTDTGIYYLPKYAYQDVIRNEIIKNRIFDEGVFNLAKKFIKPESSVIDAGANYGQMSVLFSNIYSNSTVYAFEASNYIFNILQKNISANSKNIIGINCALSNINTESYIMEPDLSKSGTYGALKIEIKNDIIGQKQKKTIFKKIDDFNFEKKVSFMKIDVQGWDLKVLEGSVQTIEKNRMPIIFEYENIFEKEMNYNFDDFTTLIKKIDYKFVTVWNNNFLVLPKEYKQY